MSDPENEEWELRQPMRAIKTNSVASMGQYLLQGWAMLADGCPECGVRLVPEQMCSRQATGG